MTHKTFTFWVLFILLFNHAGLLAQEAIPASGGEASGSGGSASYTVGQIVYTCHTGINGNSISQGVQQPYEISEVTGIMQGKDINLSFAAYPNPTFDYLTLNIDNFEAIKLSYQLYDMNGKLLKNKIITAHKTKITTKELTPAIYFLKVTDNEKVIKSFKIIKNN